MSEGRLRDVSHEYEVVTEDGKWCGASADLEDARAYALANCDDRVMKIVWIRRMVVEEYPVSKKTKESK